MAATRKYLNTAEEFRQTVSESLSMWQVLGHIGLVLVGSNYKTVQSRIEKLRLDISHFTGAGWNTGARYKASGQKATLEGILVENPTYAFTYGLRGRLLKEKVKCLSVSVTAWQSGVNNPSRWSCIITMVLIMTIDLVTCACFAPIAMH